MVEDTYNIVWELREGIDDFQLVQSEGSQDQIGHLEEQWGFNRQKIGNCIKTKGIIGGMAQR